ncbi:Flagellar motor switch protein FliG [Maioricimonas rarisocia]|uniref:Flagellar motor switch protein FliG n=1 Tax=Maioricimonas rarisocia TaxID=2528026 RepID=A0A517ZE13_9PLAN|nr:FliG C-terminal domain-containing protein [Maioricimonas rarisocia]QDU40695.1 Flagellar motor switch protein FliG [Maioricimonas rarisocia]
MDNLRAFRGRVSDWNARVGQGRLLPVVAAVAVAGPLMWLAARSGEADRVPVLSGKRWTTEQVAAMTSRLRSAGLDDFEQAGGQILVSAERLPKYEEVLGQPETRVAHWAQTWEEARGRLNLLSGRRDEETAEEIARARLLSELLSQMPDIDFADVVWDEDTATGWRRPEKARATVYLKPKPGRRITLELVHSVRLAVAGSRRNLDPSDIVVMDLDGMITYDESTLAPTGSGTGPHLSHLAAVYRQQIVSALADLAPTDVVVRAISSSRPQPQPSFAQSPPLAATTHTALRPAGRQGGPNTRLDLTAAEVKGAETVVAPVATLPRGAEDPVASGDPLPQLYVTVDLPSFETVAGGAFPSAETLQAEVVRRIQDLLLPSAAEGVHLAGLDVDVMPPLPVEVTPPPPSTVAGMTSLLEQIPEKAWVVIVAASLFCAAVWQLGRRRTDRKPRRASRHHGHASTGPRDAREEEAFAFLLGNERASEWLPHEDPQDLAVVLLSLGPEAAERFLARLPDDLKVALLEMVGAQTVPPDAATIERVAGRLAQRAAAQPAAAATSAVSEPVSSYHNRLPRETVPETLGAANWVTSFEEIVRLDLASLRGLYETAGADVWAMALLGASDRVKRAVMRSLTEPQRDELSRRIAEPQPTRLRDIDEAQQQIVSLVGRTSAATETVLS